MTDRFETVDTDEHTYTLTITRASGESEDHDVPPALFKATREGDRADLEIWHGEVVAFTVRGERDEVGPTSIGAMWLSLLPGWAGLGLQLWSATGEGRLGTLVGWVGTRAFAWMFLGASMLWPLGLLITGRISGWEWVVGPLFWVFGVAVSGFLLHAFGEDWFVDGPSWRFRRARARG